MLKLFQRQDRTVGTKILVSSFSNAFGAEMDADYSAYRRCYSSVQTRLLYDFLAFENEVRGVDVLHLLATLDLEGQISTDSEKQFAVATLLDKCVAMNVKAVLFAGDNKADAYIRGVPAKPLNLVMTIARRGPAFPEFLGEFCTLLASGLTFPLAWVKIAPQGPGPWHARLPECIFSAGRPKAVLLP
jgi:hypothetical protein